MENDDGSESELAEDSREGDSDKECDNQPEFEWVPLNCFKDLYQCTPIYKCMAEYGQNCVPLSVVGMFMNYVGNHILHYI